MSRSLSQRRDDEILGYNFIDPRESVYPLKNASTDTAVEYELELELEPTPPDLDLDLEPAGADFELPVVPTGSSSEWKLSPNGFYETILKNGLHVILYQTSAQPTVQCQTVYHFGSNDEIGASERGLAHICEHMIFKGTKNDSSLYLSETDITSIARMLGSTYNAFTSTNITSYHFNSCPEYTEGFLRILAASMFDTKLSEQHLRSEKLAVLAEMSAGKDSIFRDALIHIRQNMYGEQFPQFWPTIGNITDISELHSDTLQDFYTRLYHPRNATLFVVGDMSDADLAKYKNGFIEGLFATDVSVERAGAPADIKPADIGIRSITDSKTTRSFQKTFHTLSANESFMLFSFPLTGMRDDVHSKKGFSAIDSIMFDGEDSRLYKTLVTNADLGVTSIGGFVQLDKEFSEYHIVIQGTRAIQQNEQTIKDTIMHSFLRPISETEVKKCTNALSFSEANTNTNIGSLTSAWVQDFNLTKNSNNFWDTSDNWIRSAKQRMLEMQQVYANSSTWSVSYKSCSKDDAKLIKQTMLESNEKFTTKLKNPEHRRETALETPVAISAFRTWSSNLACELPVAPFRTIQGSWTHFASPDFQLIKIAVRPVQRSRLQAGTDGHVLSYLSDVIGEVFPQEEYKLAGLRGAFSGSLAVVATYSQNADQRSEAFASWVSRYASPFSIEDQAKIGTYFEDRKSHFVNKWTEASASRKISADALVFEHIRQNCSDEYFVNNFEDSFQQVDHVIRSFDVGAALATWNRYWGETQQIMTHHEQTQCELASDVNAQPEHDVSEPVAVRIRVHKTLELQPNPDVPLNQSIVAIARRGAEGLTKSNSEYWTIRSIAAIIQFHSLGSRLYDLRAAKGLFYSASGAFSAGATEKCVGYDYISARVNIGTERVMISKLLEFSLNTKTGMKKPVTENELLSAKRILVDSWRKRNTESEIVSNWSDHSDYFKDIASLPSNMIQNLNAPIGDDRHISAKMIDSFIARDDPYYFSVMCS